MEKTSRQTQRGRWIGGNEYIKAERHDGSIGQLWRPASRGGYNAITWYERGMTRAKVLRMLREGRAVIM